MKPFSFVDLEYQIKNIPSQNRTRIFGIPITTDSYSYYVPLYVQEHSWKERIPE